MSDTCSICQDLFKTPKLLLCGHTFCRQCIDDNVKLSRYLSEIKCPLCRKISIINEDRADGLMDNFFAADRTFSPGIIQCTNCSKITIIKRCRYCSICLCDSCITLHEELDCSVRKMGSISERCKTQRGEDGTEDLLLRLEEQMMYGTIRTKYCFELNKKILVSNLYDDDDDTYDLNVNLSCISCYDGKNCIVAPNGETLVIMFDENGKEIRRECIPIRVVNIAHGTAGYPLIIENSTSLVYEYTYGSVRKIIWTQKLLPYALSSLNNGKVVLVGTVEEGRHGGMSVFEYCGKLVTEVITVDDEYLLEFPQHVSVNMKTNDIYVGDVSKRQVIHFKEDGAYVSSYEKIEYNFFLGNGLTSEVIRGRSTFPFALTFSQCSDLLFAGYISEVDRSIHLLSTSLEFLGVVASPDDLGIPRGLSCDDFGRLYIGDGADGSIRVFRLSNFVNKF